MTDRKLSHYQEAIREQYLTAGDNMIIKACPGSGKTFMLETLWRESVLSQGERLVYLVFNRANADEAKGKLPLYDGSYINTLNGFGASVINFNRHGLKLERNKVRYLIKDKYPFHNDSKGSYKQDDLHTLTMLCKAYVVENINDVQMVYSKADLYGYSDICQHALDIYNMSLDHKKQIDFADQLLWPVVFTMQKPTYKVALIDECQDLSPVQAKLIEDIATRYIFVGDPRQAIYAFRGADSNSMAYLQETFSAMSMPLRLTYRCAKAIVAEAQQVYADDIEALETAREGIVRSVDSDNRYKENYKENATASNGYSQALIICRNNAPLVAMAYMLLRNKIPVRMIGRDFGSNLIKFIKRLDAISINDLEAKLDLWRYEQEQMIATTGGDSDKMQSIVDKYETCLAFISMSDSATLQGLYDAIDALFSADYGVRLATIHRSKGLEAEKVYFLEPQLIPSQYSRSDSQREQEYNLKYVGITRAKNDLVYLM